MCIGAKPDIASQGDVCDTYISPAADNDWHSSRPPGSLRRCSKLIHHTVRTSHLNGPPGANGISIEDEGGLLAPGALDAVLADDIALAQKLQRLKPQFLWILWLSCTVIFLLALSGCLFCLICTAEGNLANRLSCLSC